jgi:hypothetical protein
LTRKLCDQVLIPLKIADFAAVGVACGHVGTAVVVGSVGGGGGSVIVIIWMSSTYDG